MPTYEYECEKCGLRFEAFQSITAEPLTTCNNSDCGGAVKRLFSAGAGFIFKGSGFYITDYRSDSYKKAAQSDGGSISAASPSSAKATSSATTSSASGTSSSSSSAPTSSTGSGTTSSSPSTSKESSGK